MNSPYLRLKSAAAFVLLVVLGIAIISWCCHAPANPEGVYYDEFIGSSEPTYWVFREGRVWLEEKGASNIAAGVFLRSNGVWILRGGPGTADVILKATPFGLNMFGKPGSGMSRYLPKRGFSWLKPGESYDLAPTPQQTSFPEPRTDERH